MKGKCPNCGFDFENPPEWYKSIPNWEKTLVVHPEAVTISCTCGYDIPVEAVA